MDRDRIDTDKQALERVEKEKLAKLELRLSFVQHNENSAHADEDDDGEQNNVTSGSGSGALEKRKRKYFTEEEDAKLIEAFNTYGSNWEMIVAKTGLERTARQCQDRFKRLKKGKGAFGLVLFCFLCLSCLLKEEASPVSSNVLSSSSSLAAVAAVATPSPTARPAARQQTIPEKFGVTPSTATATTTINHNNNNNSISNSNNNNNNLVNEFKQKLDEQKMKTFEALDALRSAHERAEVAETEAQTIKLLYKKELMLLLRTMGKNEFEEARKELAMNSLRYGTIKWEVRNILNY